MYNVIRSCMCCKYACVHAMCVFGVYVYLFSLDMLPVVGCYLLKNRLPAK